MERFLFQLPLPNIFVEQLDEMHANIGGGLAIFVLACAFFLILWAYSDKDLKEVRTGIIIFFLAPPVLYVLGIYIIPLGAAVLFYRIFKFALTGER